MDSEELQRKAPAGAESCDSALQGTIVLRPSRTISSRGGYGEGWGVRDAGILNLNLRHCNRFCGELLCRTPNQ